MSTLVDALPGKFPSCSFVRANSKGEKVKATVGPLFPNENPLNDSPEHIQSNGKKNDQDSEEEEFPGDMPLQFDQALEFRANFNANKKRSKKRNQIMYKPFKVEEDWCQNAIQQNHFPENDIKTEVGSTSTVYTEEMRNKRVRQGAEPYIPVHQPRDSAQPSLNTNNATFTVKKEPEEGYQQVNECTSQFPLKIVGNTTNEIVNGSQSPDCCGEEEFASEVEKSTLPPFGMPGNIRASRPTNKKNVQPQILTLKKTSHKQHHDTKDVNSIKLRQPNSSQIQIPNNGVTIKSLDDTISKKSVDVTIGTINSEASDIPLSSMVKTEFLQLEDNVGYKQHLNKLLNGYMTPFIDSHCHLDYIYNKIYNETPKKESTEIGHFLSDWKEQLQVFPRNFIGCIPNFIDPRLFHKINEKYYDIDWLRNQVKDRLVLGATYGIHPKYVHLYDNKVEEILESFLRDEAYKPVAVGECGLDTYRNFESFEQQKLAFEKQLRLGCRYNLPIVIHCRSDTSDETYETEIECLNVMKEILNPFHTVHRHCFTMDIEVYKMWTSNFPNTYFGFTPCIEKATVKQLDAIKKIPLTRILLETDAPYFRPTLYDKQGSVPTGPSKTSFPGMAIYTAQLLSNIKQVPLEHVLDITAQNTRRCYSRLKEPM